MMRTLDEIMKTSPEMPPFSNGSEASYWMASWCDRCHHPVEIAWQKYSNGQRKTQMKGYEGGCPLLMAAYAGHTPAEWLEQPDRTYHCIEFRGPGDGGGEPRPKPDPPNMDGLFDTPERKVRMLKQADEPSSVLAGGV